MLAMNGVMLPCRDLLAGIDGDAMHNHSYHRHYLDHSCAGNFQKFVYMTDAEDKIGPFRYSHIT